MSFFQNVFNFEFRPSLFGADRQYQMNFNLPANGNGLGYVLSGNAEPYNFSTYNSLTISYAIDTAFMNFSPILINVAGSTPAATTAQEVVNAMNANSYFNTLFTAEVYTTTVNGVITRKVLFKYKNTRPIFRFYVPNNGAESVLLFNKNAPIRELPSVFAKYSIDNRFNYPNLGADRIIELNPASPMDAALITAAGFDPLNPKEDWELLSGTCDGYFFYKRTYSGGKKVTEIKYYAGAQAGDPAKKTYYVYSGADLIEEMETPYVLQSGDLITPP